MPGNVPAGGLDSNITNSNNLSNRKRGLWIHVVFPPKEEKSKEELLPLLLHEAVCICCRRCNSRSRYNRLQKRKRLASKRKKVFVIKDKQKTKRFHDYRSMQKEKKTQGFPLFRCPKIFPQLFPHTFRINQMKRSA